MPTPRGASHWQSSVVHDRPRGRSGTTRICEIRRGIHWRDTLPVKQPPKRLCRFDSCSLHQLLSRRERCSYKLPKHRRNPPQRAMISGSVARSSRAVGCTEARSADRRTHCARRASEASPPRRGDGASEARSADRRTKCELAKPAFQSIPIHQWHVVQRQNARLLRGKVWVRLPLCQPNQPALLRSAAHVGAEFFVRGVRASDKRRAKDQSAPD